MKKIKYGLLLALALLVGIGGSVGAQTAVGYYTRYRETDAASVPTPLTNDWQNVYIDSTTHTPYRKDYTGAATAIAGSGVGTGTVTSVACGAGLSCSPSPLTTAGTLSITPTGPGAATYCGGSTYVLSVVLNDKGQTTGVTCGTPAGGSSVSLTCGSGLTCSPTTITGTGSVTPDTTILTTLTGAQTLTNKTMSGASNTFSSIPESAVTNLISDLAGKLASTTLGNYVFSGNNVDLSASGTMTVGSTNTGDIVFQPGAQANAFTFSNYFGAGTPSLWFNGAPGTSTFYIYQAAGGLHFNSGSTRVSVTGGAFEPDNDLVVGNGASTQRWAETWSRHFVGSQTTAPTATLQGAPSLGSGATVTVTGSDAAMLLVITSGTSGFTGGAQVLITYNTAYAVKPKAVIMTPVNQAAATTSPTIYYVDDDSASTTTGGFMISTYNAPVSNSSVPMKFSVSVIQ